jgi:amino acid permease
MATRRHNPKYSLKFHRRGLPQVSYFPWHTMDYVAYTVQLQTTPSLFFQLPIFICTNMAVVRTRELSTLGMVLKFFTVLDALKIHVLSRLFLLV